MEKKVVLLIINRGAEVDWILPILNKLSKKFLIYSYFRSQKSFNSLKSNNELFNLWLKINNDYHIEKKTNNFFWKLLRFFFSYFNINSEFFHEKIHDLDYIINKIKLKNNLPNVKIAILFSELGILGGLLYLSIFIFLFINLLFLLIKSKSMEYSLIYFILGCSLFVYALDASLNFPVARPLMQSSLILLIGMILYLINENKNFKLLFNTLTAKSFFLLFLILIVLSTTIHIISYNSLTKQGKLLFEFNNNKFEMSLDELDQISDEFPNLTETALPIKAMKARYYYLNNLKDKAHKFASEGAKDNPFIYFPENLKGQFFFQEGNIDSAYIYSKVAFENIPRNKPHFDLYIKTLVNRKDISGIENAFNKAKEVFGDDSVIWQLYLQALAGTRNIGDPHAMQQAANAFNLFPDNQSIFTLYKILTYGQARMIEAEKIGREAVELYKNKSYDQAFILFKQANDLDPLDPVFPLNAGFALFESKKFESAISFFNLVIPTRHTIHSLRAMRYKALSLINLNRRGEACKLLDQLRIKGKKRMYFQEYNKYCK